MQRDNFLLINAFATLNAVLIEQLKKCAKNAKMVSWQIRNDINESLSKFLRSKSKDGNPDYYTIISDVVTDRFSNEKNYYFVYIM